MDWNKWLKDSAVMLKAPPYGLPSAPASTQNNIVELQKDYRGFITPDDYNSFVMQIGPGTLGRVRIFAPMNQLGFPDLRMHQYRLMGKFEEPEFFVVHNFDLKTLLFFAQDSQQDLWFGWNYNESGDYTIYAVDEQPKAPPPKRVAKTFSEFLENICLGTGIQKAGLRKYTEDPAKDEEPKDTWDSDEEIEYEAPPRVWIPFAIPRAFTFEGQ